MIRKVVAAGLGAGVSVVTLRAVVRRGGERLIAAPRTTPDEAELGGAVDALGGEVVRLRSRDGLQLTARWLPAAATMEAPADPSAEPKAWRPDAHEAILLLHGWSGSSTPGLVEYGPFLRRTAGVLGLDSRGHGGSDAAPTTFGYLEVEDVAGALAWLGERGIERVAIVGMSMGGVTAIAAVAILGDGSLTSADGEPDAPAHVLPPRRPRIVAIVGDAVAPELTVPIASRIGVPGARFVAGQLLDAAARRLGGDPRDTEPGRMIGLLEGMPILLVSGDADSTVPLDDARRLAAVAPAGTTHWIVPGAEHGRAHATDPAAYESRVTDHLRGAYASARGSGPIIGAPEAGSPDLPTQTDGPDR
ncbi:MAG: alpha/beta fold hydrolase [Chloroflexota bacterium]